MNVLLIGLGGFIGSVLRYLVNDWVQRTVAADWFPFGTLTVNLAGCLLIGVASGLIPHGDANPGMRLFLVIGMLGGFTTFSTFGLDTVRMIEDRLVLPSLAYVSAHVISGIGAVFAGLWLVRWLR